MYHYDPFIALEELKEEGMLPNPVHVRDMIVRTRLAPERLLEMNRTFQSYLQTFGKAQAQAREILEGLAIPRSASISD
ncbi:MAG TPA: hypothetical protein VKV15_13045 [Bryobacteraceae bacterium]|nr:hypothetical protein [Bryobacteraceae bacterium]